MFSQAECPLLTINVYVNAEAALITSIRGVKQGQDRGEGLLKQEGWIKARKWDTKIDYSTLGPAKNAWP
ncbi:hypothetical protein CVT26_004348 [Gymnopilus dilepis]|uniref:Uncharacterized protein n=1 Tax=Gymnopilus dilepis TaxID=231916 RepID=A0A409W296_9AGAR|nr:hypothetical protein CVT26_004348 [Gymnopilus dilepis]